MQGTFSGTSMLGSTLIILSYATIPALRRHPTTLVFYLSLCDLCFCAKYFIVAVLPEGWTYQYAHETCLLEAVWSQFFGKFQNLISSHFPQLTSSFPGIASVTWNAMISINLLRSIIDPFSNTANKEIFYHAFVWLVAIVTTILMVSSPQPSIFLIFLGCYPWTSLCSQW